MSGEPEDQVTRARRRAQRVPGRLDPVVNTAALLCLCGYGMAALGWIPYLPVNILGLVVFNPLSAWLIKKYQKDSGFELQPARPHLLGGWLTNPFRRRARPLLLSGIPFTPLPELMNIPAQTHVHVRGRIRPLAPMATYLGDVDDAVYCRIDLHGVPSKFLAYKYIRRHRVEMRDFLLVDETGATVEIRMHQAEVTLPRRMFHTKHRGVANELLAHLPDPPSVGLYDPTLAEHWLAAGDEIEVLGTIERVPDPTQEALPRELPTRPVLVSTGDRPLTVQLVRGC